MREEGGIVPSAEANERKRRKRKGRKGKKRGGGGSSEEPEEGDPKRRYEGRTEGDKERQEREPNRKSSL